MQDPRNEEQYPKYEMSSSRWLDDCWSYELLKQELNFMQPDDDGIAELTFFMTKAFLFTPAIVATCQVCAVELGIRMTIGR